MMMIMRMKRFMFDECVGGCRGRLSCLMYWPTLQWSQTVSIDESGLELQPDRWLSVHGRSIVAS